MDIHMGPMHMGNATGLHIVVAGANPEFLDSEFGSIW